MRNIIQLTAEDVKQAIVAYVHTRYGTETGQENVQLTTETHGQFDDLEFEFTGAEVELPDTPHGDDH